MVEITRKLARRSTKDITRIVKVAATAGFLVTQADARWLWENHAMATTGGTWMTQDGYSDEELLNILKLNLIDEPL